MRRSLRCLRLCLALALVPRHAEAQLCNGTVPFTSGPVRAGLGWTFGDNYKSYGVQMAAGGATGLYGAFDVERDKFDDVVGSEFGLGAGYQISANPRHTAQLCPEAGFSALHGPAYWTPSGKAQTSANAFLLGASFGGLASSSPSFGFAPFFGAAFVREKTTVTLPGQEQSSANRYGLVQLGAGFILGRRTTIQPSLSVPFGLPHGRRTFSIGFAVNMGRSTSG